VVEKKSGGQRTGRGCLAAPSIVPRNAGLGEDG
jgi:hypothetical protein